MPVPARVWGENMRRYPEEDGESPVLGRERLRGHAGENDRSDPQAIGPGHAEQADPERSGSASASCRLECLIWLQEPSPASFNAMRYTASLR